MRFLLILILGALGIAAVAVSPLRAVEQPTSPPLETSWKHLRELESTLARQGVRMAMLDPDRLGTGLIGLYDEVKQRQLL